MSATFDRQIRPIYDAIDSGSNKSAIVACNKLLKKQPKNDLVKALKALALVRSQKVEESLVVCDEVLAGKPTDESILSAMTHVLRGLGRHSDMIAMYDTAWKQIPQSEELGIQTFHANARTGNWKQAQQVSTKLHKQSKDDRYLFWSVFCAVLQANDPATPEALRPVLYKLAERLIGSSSVPSFYTPDRFFVHLLVLRELEQYEEAVKLLEGEPGKAICGTSLYCDELRRDIYKRKGIVKEEGQRAEERISKQKDRNWLEFLSLLDATFHDVSSTDDPSEEAKTATKEAISKTQTVLTQVAEEDGSKDRSGPLALIELEKRAKKHDLSTDDSALYDLVESYFRQFGDKTCAFEDLLPYISFEGEVLSKWTSYLQTHTSSETAADLRRTINALKLIRYNLDSSELNPESELSRVSQYVKLYTEGLKLGEGLPETELQPADDLVILAAQTLASLWKITDDVDFLYNAVVLLDFGLTNSKQSYVMRLLLIRIYHLLGAPSLALEQYRLLGVKQVQTDTLSHYVLSRASTYSLSSLGDLTYSTECMEASQIYMSNSQDTAEFIVRAFQAERYSQIQDFVSLEERLDNSLQRDLMKIEHVRMRVSHEPINADLVDMELIELKFIFDRVHHDNRDFSIIPNYQPHSQPSFLEQTTLFGKVPNQAWLSVFLKIYIKAFQQASDLDDTVEDKLLIGDRPKPNLDPETKVPLNERLAKRNADELEELTTDEAALLQFATGLSDWLGPHHDYIRPPPSAVLAEAAKLTMEKTGHPLKGVIVPANGENGKEKKEGEPPAVTEPPEIVLKHFDDMKERFKAALEAGVLPAEILHIVTLTQEAFLLFTVETQRFKPAEVSKKYKLAAMSQNFKDIRTKGISVLGEMSTELEKLAAAQSTAEQRKAFVEACSPLESSSGLDQEFIGGVAKKVTEARKQILEGIAKGIVKVCKNNA